MKEVILDTLIDALKLLPFLYIAFLLIEILEHKLTNKSKKVIAKSGRLGPLLGSLLGLVPQCGFSVMATNLYVTRIVSLGTLIAIYLSTSDEMIPILVSGGVSAKKIIFILIIKFGIGLISGYFIDLFFRKKEQLNYEICDEEHCHCKDGIFKSALIHALKILAFILLVSFIINILFEAYGENILSKTFMKNSIISPFIASLVGLIPNCGASVIISELFVNNVISLGSTIAGLLTGSGVALMVLFRTNHNMKENFKILCIIYFVGSISGLIIDLLLKI